MGELEEEGKEKASARKGRTHLVLEDTTVISEVGSYDDEESVVSQLRFAIESREEERIARLTGNSESPSRTPDQDLTDHEDDSSGRLEVRVIWDSLRLSVESSLETAAESKKRR